MDTYTLLRQIADSWVLLAMFGFFAAVALWAFLPSQSQARKDASMIPFRNEQKTCSRNCATCGCTDLTAKLKGQIDG